MRVLYRKQLATVFIDWYEETIVTQLLRIFEIKCKHAIKRDVIVLNKQIYLYDR